MGNKVLTLVALVLVFAIGFTARLAYEQSLRPAFAQDEDPRTGLDCKDYNSQAEAQAALRDDPSDPNVLDEDDGADDGIACETYPYDNPARDETPVTTTTAPSSPEPTQASPQPTAQPSSPQPSPQPNPQRRDPPMPESGGLPGGALPARPDGSCPTKYPVKHNNICLPR
jgi:hypothetical protein